MSNLQVLKGEGQLSERERDDFVIAQGALYECMLFELWQDRTELASHASKLLAQFRLEIMDLEHKIEKLSATDS